MQERVIASLGSVRVLRKMSEKTEPVAKPIPELTEFEITKLVHRIWDSNFKLVDYKVTPYSSQKLGFLADHFCIFLDVRDPKTMELKSKKLFLKTKPLKNMCNMVESMNVFEKEICFYNEILPLMTKNFVGNPWAPTCYSSSENSLIIEDLREKGFNMHEKILSKEELTSAMKTLAVMHAASITAEEKLGRPLNEVYPQAFQMKYFFEGNFHDWISTGFNLAEALARKFGLDGDKMKNICKKYFYQSLGPSKTKINVASHADTWSNNLMFTEDSPPRCILVDFQMLRYCPLVYDVLFMLYLCSKREFRKKYETLLLRHYYTTLCEILRSNKRNARVPAWSELVHGVDEIRLGVAILSMLYFPTSTLDGDKCADLFRDPDEMTKFVMVDRVDKTLEMMGRDEKYAERIAQSVQEVYELGVSLEK